MALLTLGAHHLQQRLEEQLTRHVAEHLRIVADAAERYLLNSHGPFELQQKRLQEERLQWETEQRLTPKDQRLSLEEWRYQQLINNKYLPERFNPTNLYGQCYALYVEAKTAPQPHQQLLVMTTKGRAIQERFLRQSARHLGRQGGYLSEKKSEKESENITGSQQGWHLPLPPKTLYQTSEQPATANPSSSSNTTAKTANPPPQQLEKANNQPGLGARLKSGVKKMANRVRNPLGKRSKSPSEKPVSQPSEEPKESDDTALPLRSETTATALASNPAERAEHGDYEQPGHLASLSLLYGSDVLQRSALLHRTTTPHQKEELTQMETDLSLQDHHISFQQDHYKGELSASKKGELSASKMEITYEAQGLPKQQVTLAVDDSNPTITINRGSKTLKITAQNISFSSSSKPEYQEAVKDYSPPELHSYWNKVAYYELSDRNEAENFTQYLCQQPAPGSDAPTLGRLFMLGFEKQRITQLYLCATNQAGQQAHLLQEMTPPE